MVNGVHRVGIKPRYRKQMTRVSVPEVEFMFCLERLQPWLVRFREDLRVDVPHMQKLECEAILERSLLRFGQRRNADHSRHAIH